MAAPNLPVGVIKNNTDGVSRDLRNIDILTAEEVAQLWTTYHSKQSLLANDIGRRLTNFFWRLWSNDRLRNGLSGSQVALLFEGISEGNIIRTTPKSSPRHSRLIPASQSSIDSVAETVEEIRRLSHNPDVPSQDEAVTPESRVIDFAYQSTGPVQDGAQPRRDSVRPPPILKKPGSESSGSVKTARIQPPDFKTSKTDPDHDEPMSPEEVKELTRQLSIESVEFADGAIAISSKPSPPSSSRQQTSLPTREADQAAQMSSQRMSRSSSGQGRASKKKAFVVSRKRPVVSRRQSSQVSQASNASSSKASPALKSSSTFDNFSSFAETGPSDMRRTQSSLGEDSAGYKLTTSRSASPISQSALRRVSRDHRAHEEDDSPATVHNRALSAIAVGNEFIPLVDGDTRPVNMRRQSSSASFRTGAVTPKGSLASSSSSNVQAAGHISVEQAPSGISNTPRVALNMFKNAGSFLTGKGKGRAMFDIGPPDTDSPDVSRRPSVEFGQTPVSPKTTSFLASQRSPASTLPPSRSQSQLSGLLEQEKKRQAERERVKAQESKGKSPRRR